jgi:hypothetical protein
MVHTFDLPLIITALFPFSAVRLGGPGIFRAIFALSAT